MKSFFKMFADSAKELKSVRTITATGLLIAASVIIEMYSINIGGYLKVNFAFISIAVIGMLFGPTVCFGAGLICDVIGFFVSSNSGGFMPVYTLVAGLQGIIYGVCLYQKYYMHIELKGRDISLIVRATLARLLDVVIINLLINTKLLIHYGWISESIYTKAVIARSTKNFLELAADLPLLYIILPVCLIAYKRTSRGSAKA